MFNDVYKMSQSHVKDLISGSPIATPSANMVIFGWVCSDRSFLNNNRQSFARAYSQRVGTSANTFDACVAYLKKHQPSLAVGENIVTIDDNGDLPDSGGHIDKHSPPLAHPHMHEYVQ